MTIAFSYLYCIGSINFAPWYNVCMVYLLDVGESDVEEEISHLHAGSSADNWLFRIA